MHWTRVAVVVGVLAVVTGACSSGGADEARVTELEAQVNQLQASVSLLTDRLTETETAAAEQANTLSALVTDVFAQILSESAHFETLTADSIPIGTVEDGITIEPGRLAMTVGGVARVAVLTESGLGSPIILITADDGRSSIYSGGVVQLNDSSGGLSLSLEPSDGAGEISLYDGSGEARIMLDVADSLGVASPAFESGQGPSIWILSFPGTGAGAILIRGNDGGSASVRP